MTRFSLRSPAQPSFGPVIGPVIDPVIDPVIGPRRSPVLGRALGLVAVAALSACTSLPDVRMPRFSGTGSTGGGMGAAPTTPAAPSASLAESACVDAGIRAGFDVQGITGTAEVLDDQGVAQSRDVMLRINSGGRTLDVRCSYAYATADARIMTL